MIPDYLSWKPARCATDLAAVDREITDLAISGKTNSLELVTEFRQVSRLWLMKVNQGQFERCVDGLQPNSLCIYEMRVADLRPITSLSKLRELAIYWNPTTENLLGLNQLPQLRVLKLVDFPKVHDISPIGRLVALKALDLMGGFSTGWRLDSLAPLQHLGSLRHLSLQGLRVGDESLAPICRCKHLETLVIGNSFPTAEYARLAVAFPQVKCDMLKPFVRLRKPIGGKDVMVVGKGKPFLNEKSGKARLDKYVAQFETLKAKFAAE